jgi:hypothetical protein
VELKMDETPADHINRTFDQSAFINEVWSQYLVKAPPTKRGETAVLTFWGVTGALVGVLVGIAFFVAIHGVRW